MIFFLVFYRPGSNPPAFDNAGTNEGATSRVIEPEDKNIHLPTGANAEPNPYSKHF